MYSEWIKRLGSKSRERTVYDGFPSTARVWMTAVALAIAGVIWLIKR
jgi:hypothetical protein